MILRFCARSHGWSEMQCMLMRAVIGSWPRVIRVLRLLCEKERPSMQDFDWLHDE